MNLQSGISCWLWAWVEVCCWYSLIVHVSLTQKGRVTGGFFFACRQRLYVWLRFFKLNCSLMFNLFSFFAAFFNGLQRFLHV